MEVREINNQYVGKEKPMIEELRELKKFKEEAESNPKKMKKIKIPRKAKVKKRKLKKGFVGVLKIDENGVISGEKQKISGSAFKDHEGLYHATEGEEILMWEGKYPVILQPTWRNNPINVKKGREKNETYGQPYIKAKMLADTIKVKAKGGSIIIWILIGAAVLFGINYFAGGKLFG